MSRKPSLRPEEQARALAKGCPLAPKPAAVSKTVAASAGLGFREFREFREFRV